MLPSCKGYFSDQHHISYEFVLEKSMNKNTAKRVVVTGIGIITAIGESMPTFGKALFNGECGIGPISLFDTTGFTCEVAAQVKIKDLKEFFGAKGIKRVSRCDILGLIATHEALLDSDLDSERCSKKDIGVVLGGGVRCGVLTPSV